VYEQGGPALEVRHTVGTRLWGEPGPWDYNAEAHLQFGTFGGAPITAGVATLDGGYTWRDAPCKPRAGLTVGYASGDENPNNPSLQTYNPLFPTGAFFNRANELPGPINFLEVHPKLFLFPTDRVRLITDYNLFWRASENDGLYTFATTLLRPSNGSTARFVGSALTAEAQWQATQHLSLVASYTHYFAGPFLKQTGFGEDIDYIAVFATYRY
jgi:hypothetical protein